MSVNNDPMTAAAETRSNASAPPPPEIHSRTLLVAFQASPAELDSLGAQAATWTLEPKTSAEIFGVDKEQPQDVTLQQLQKSIVHKITLDSYKTTFPDTHSLYINGITSQEFTQNGDTAHIFFHGAGQSTTPQELYVNKGDGALTRQWMDEYPGFTSANLDTHKAIAIEGAQYHFVSKDHPVIGLFKSNEDSLGVKVDKDAAVNEHYRVNSNLFKDGCDSLKKNLLANMVLSEFV